MAEPSKLGRYELRSVLGKGAMGVVYEGFDPTLDRRVAVKTILKSVVLDEETERSYSARFAREAKAVGRLNHPNIVQVYDFGEQDDVAYIVMEFIEGRELRSHFEARERFDAAETVRIMGELLDALHVAHESGVIHRDVKPANVMLDARRRVKLADFGVARVQDGTDRSKGGTMVGTPAFMSPEQVSGARVDRRTDIFSAGIVLYQLLTGEEPFKGDGAWTVAKHIMQDEPPRPSTIATRVSPAFDQIVNRALAKKPDQRFASAKEFSLALQGALSGGPEQRGSDAEIEFWRSIQNSNDPAEYEVYLKEFPAGVYAELARIKIAKLPRIVARLDTDEVKKLAEETARLESELAQREAAYKQRAAEAEARRLAEEQSRAEADARREAEAKARAAAGEKARLAAIEKAQQEAKAEVARREAEIRQRESDFRRREAEATAAAAAAAKADAEAKAKREAVEKARQEADARARAVAQEQAKRQTEEIARRQDAIKQREADLKRLAALAPSAKLPVLQLAIGFALVAGAVIGAWYWSASSDEARLAQLTVALEAATKASQELNVARDRQQELRKRLEVAQQAEEEARAKGDQAKLKELQEQTKRAEAEAQKQNELVKQREAEAKKAGDAAKVADAQKQSDMARAVEKAAQEKAAQTRAAELAAAEKVLLEKAAVEKAAAEKLAAAKASAEKRAADKSAGEKVAMAKPAAATPEGLSPGSYAFRIMTGSGSGSMCDQNGLEEDIEIRAGAPQAISGQQFSNLQIRSAADGSIAGKVFDESNRRIAGEIALTGHVAADGYAGTYSGRYQNFACGGQWTLTRRGSKEAERPAALANVNVPTDFDGRWIGSGKWVAGTARSGTCVDQEWDIVVADGLISGTRVQQSGFWIGNSIVVGEIRGNGAAIMQMTGKDDPQRMSITKGVFTKDGFKGTDELIPFKSCRYEVVLKRR